MQNRHADGEHPGPVLLGLNPAVFLYPAPELGDLGVDAGFVLQGTAFAPADHARHKDPPIGVGDAQRPAGVAL